MCVFVRVLFVCWYVCLIVCVCMVDCSRGLCFVSGMYLRLCVYVHACISQSRSSTQLFPQLPLSQKQHQRLRNKIHFLDECAQRASRTQKKAAQTHQVKKRLFKIKPEEKAARKAQRQFSHRKQLRRQRRQRRQLSRPTKLRKRKPPRRQIKWAGPLRGRAPAPKRRFDNEDLEKQEKLG